MTVLLEGIVAVIVGIFLITNPASTLIFLVIFLGIYWLVTGVINLIPYFWNRSQWGWKLFTGIVGIIAGLLIIQKSTDQYPGSAGHIRAGVGLPRPRDGDRRLIQAFRGGGWGVGVLGAVSIFLGFLLIARPLVAGIPGFPDGISVGPGWDPGIHRRLQLRSLSKHYKEEEALAADRSRASRFPPSQVPPLGREILWPG